MSRASRPPTLAFVLFGLLAAQAASVALGCSEGEEAGAIKRGDSSSNDRVPRDLDDLPVQTDDVLAEGVCTSGCAEDEPGPVDATAAGGSTASTGSGGGSTAGSPDSLSENGMSEPPPPVELPTTDQAPVLVATAMGTAYVAPPVPPPQLPVECVGGSNVAPPNTPCGKAMVASHPGACSPKWTTSCVAQLEISTDSECQAVIGKCPRVCPNIDPNKQVSIPADVLPAPLRFDLTPVPTEPVCDSSVTFTSALYAEPHFVAVPRSFIGPDGVPIKSLQREVWQKKLDTAAYLFTLPEPFWKVNDAVPAYRKQLQNGATYANCVVARMEATGDLRATTKDAAYCKDIKPDSVVQRSPLTLSVKKLVAYSLKKEQWDASGEGGKAFRRFIVDFATRLSAVYGITPVFLVEKSYPTGYEADWQKLSAVAYIATEAFVHTGIMGAKPTAEARKAVAVTRYADSLTKWQAAGVPKERLLLAEHYGDYEEDYSYGSCTSSECATAGDKCATFSAGNGDKIHRCQKPVTIGRAGLDDTVWEAVMALRLKAAAEVGFVGTLSLGWTMPTLDATGVAYKGKSAKDKESRRERFQKKAYGSVAWPPK